MKKITFIMAAAVLAVSLPVSAQQTVPVIGVLSSGSPGSRPDQFAAFERGLKEAGYIDGKNVKIEYRWASDDYTRLLAMATELVRLPVAVIVAAGGSVSAITAHKVTKEIPIVFTTVTDPVRSGLVVSLNKPAQNATGMAGLTSELDPKRLELLQQLKPNSRVIGVLVNPKRPGIEAQALELQAAADQMKVRIQRHQAAAEGQIEAAFAGMARDQVDALLVTADPFFNNHRELVVALALKARLPAIYQWRQFVTAGGLMSYGPSIIEAYELAGTNAGQILKGRKPADIPVIRPKRFELAINLKTARAMGIPIPRVLRVRADEVID